MITKEIPFEVMEEEKKSVIRATQEDLWKCNIWKELFWEIVSRPCNQDEFYLVGEKITKDYVDVYLYNFLKNLKSKYQIRCHRETQKNAIILYLGFTKTSCCSRKISRCIRDEIHISIYSDYVHLNLLGFEKVFSLFNYQIVQNVLEELCREIFEHMGERYIEFLDFCKKMEDSIDKLTYKTIEIARSSIESIYCNSAEEPKEIGHALICSVVKIGGKDTVILYQDFLDDPQTFIKKLQKK